MFFLNKIDCTECQKDMLLNSFDKSKRIISYKCSCGAVCDCDFDLVGMDKADTIFGLNETGLLTYKCSDCNYNVREYLSGSKERNSKILDKAFKRQCKKCSDK